MRYLVLCFMLLLTGCALDSLERGKPAQQPETLTLTPVSYGALEGWGTDDAEGFFTAFQKSCGRIQKSPPDKAFGRMPEAGTYGDWQALCARLAAKGTPLSSEEVQAFVVQNFTPYAVRNGKNPEGLFTGYYEASLKGSRVKTEVYRTPLYSRPDDLVMVDLGEFREELKGQRIAGRVLEGSLKPYETREKIVAGAWPHTDKVLVWVADPVEAFFVQIQGSGIVTFEDGSTMRIGYAAQNGHPYTAIGRELIARGEMTKDTVSMQAIRTWLEAHPDEADSVMNLNKSYVFFQVPDGTPAQSGPLGAENVPLTAGRSLAVDHAFLPYGVPLWVDIAGPVPLRRLMVAQDTGGAIRGVVRADIFWGYGPEAEALAGPMKSQGRYWALLPRRYSPSQ